MTDQDRPTPTCDGCKYALMEDFGYSSYTVEGTTFHCLRRLHPVRQGFDRWYNEDERLLFAGKCSGFVAGDYVWVDVDRDEIPWEDPAPWWTYYIEDEERQGLAAALDAERETLGEARPESEGKP